MFCQRAENGALDPWSLDLRFGAPQIFAPNPFETLQNKGFWGLWTENRGTPKTQFQRPRIQRLILGPLIFELIRQFSGTKKSAQRGRFWDGHPADIRGSCADNFLDEVEKDLLAT